MKKIFAASIIASSVAFSGCTTRLVDFTVISSKNIDLSRGAEFTRHMSRVEGEDLVHIIIFIPTGVPNAKEALDRAIESVPGAVALLDGVITQEFFYIPWIYGQQKFVVEGTPLIDPKLRRAENINKYNVVKIDKKGDVESIKSVTKQEFEKLKG